MIPRIHEKKNRESESYDDEADDFDEGVKSEFMIFMND